MAECLIGVGLRPVHYPHLLRRPKTPVRWFEAVSENYMDSQGRPLEVLEFMRRDYPVALHGVSLSIASAELVGQIHLAGYTDMGTHLFDTHSRPVSAEAFPELEEGRVGRLFQTIYESGIIARRIQ